MSILNRTTFIPDEGTPLYQQLYEHLRAAILSGQLKQGAKLPSTRALAEALGISRTTVLNTYQQLFAEGYLESVGGSGTYVTRVLPDSYVYPSVARHSIKPDSAPPVPRLSRRAQAVVAASRPPFSRTPRQSRAFQGGQPALDAFPYDLWGSLVGKHARRLTPDLLRYQDTAGYAPLREAIAQHLIVARQVRCTPEQVIVVPGSQSGLHMAAHVLLDPGDSVWMEDPGYFGAQWALLAAGARLVPVPVDAEGLRVDEGINRAPQARMAYLTPSNQFPLGVTLSLRRRLALLEWAQQADAYLLEDDYDSEYRFAGHPLASLQGLDTADRVIYIGTFSKVLFPALRLGYLVVPPPLVDAFHAMSRSSGQYPASLEQAVVAEFIAEGHFTRHIRRMRTLYAERRNLLLTLGRDLPLEMRAPETGMQLIGWLPDGADDAAAADRARAQGVDVLAVSRLAEEPIQQRGLVLGYAAVNEADMREGIKRLARALGEAD